MILKLIRNQGLLGPPPPEDITMTPRHQSLKRKLDRLDGFPSSSSSMYPGKILADQKLKQQQNSLNSFFNAPASSSSAGNITDPFTVTKKGPLISYFNQKCNINSNPIIDLTHSDDDDSVTVDNQQQRQQDTQEYHQQQNNSNRSYINTMHKCPSYLSFASTNHSEHTQFNLKTLKQMCLQQPHPFHNTATGESINDDDDDQSCPYDNSTISSLDNGTDDEIKQILEGETLRSESPRSIDTDNDQYEINSFVTDSMGYEDKNKPHREIIQCSMCTNPLQIPIKDLLRIW